MYMLKEIHEPFKSVLWVFLLPPKAEARKDFAFTHLLFHCFSSTCKMWCRGIKFETSESVNSHSLYPSHPRPSPVCEMCGPCGLRFLFAFLFRSQRGRASEAWNHDKMERLTFLSFFPCLERFAANCVSGSTYCGAECEAAGVSSSSPNRSCDTTHTVQVEQIQHAVFCCTAACCLFSPFGEEQTKGEAEQTEQTHEGQGCSRFNP